MKHLTYKFNDGSEIDIHNDQTATIVGSTKQLAYSLWQIATQDKGAKNLHTAIFVGIVDKLNPRWKFVVDYTDHFLNNQATANMK